MVKAVALCTIILTGCGSAVEPTDGVVEPQNMSIYMKQSRNEELEVVEFKSKKFPNIGCVVSSAGYKYGIAQSCFKIE